MANIDDDKNALPTESDEFPASDNPHQLRTQNDDADLLSCEEADIAGVSRTPKMIYGEELLNPNADDQKDQFAGDEDAVI